MGHTELKKKTFYPVMSRDGDPERQLYFTLLRYYVKVLRTIYRGILQTTTNILSTTSRKRSFLLKYFNSNE